MKSRNESRRRGPLLPRSSDDRVASAGHLDRKTHQVCALAERALSVALQEIADPLLAGLVLRSVQPYPSASRLLVLLEPSAELADVELSDIVAALAKAKGLLRSAVAEAVNRKRAPEVVLELVFGASEVAP